MELVEMLRKWAEIEPTQCQLTGFNIFTIAGKGICADFTYSYTGTYIYDRELVFAWVQYAVQQATEARGWPWTLWYDFEEHGATVFNDWNKYEYEADTPAEALLSAYLMALEGLPEAIRPTSAGR